MAFVSGMLILLFVLLILLGVCVLMYIFDALSMYAIAKRRGIKNPWMAWVPYANYWLLGCVSDQYRQVAHGQICNRRKKLLVLGIISAAVGMTYSAYDGMTTVLAVVYKNGWPGEMDTVLAGFSFLFMLATLTISIILTVNMYICWFDVYRSCAPEKAVKYLVLSIIFSFLYPFFIFRIRNRDDGMLPPPVYEQPPIE